MSSSNDRDRAPAQRSRGLLKEKLELEKIKTKDGRTRVTLKPIEDELTFDKGFYVFIRALQLLRSHNEGVVLVGLGGASGSGKTAFSEKVKDFMPGIVVISMDNYNDGSKVVDGNFDDPRLTDYDLLLTNLSELKAGRAAEVPIYDFKQSKRVGYTTTPVPESRVVILEGIYALSEKLKPLLDLRVSVAGGVHFDLVKRVLRDIHRSGQGPEEIIQQITETVYPMYKAFIEPDLNAAQLKIHNSFNPFTGFMNATYILKSRRPETLTQQAVVAVLGEDSVIKTESEMYDIHLLPPNEDPETCASWLRMRNRDGRYTLMFEEWVTEGDFIISPRIQFEVSVRVLGGLMSLGYEIGTIMRRTSTIVSSMDGGISVKFDDVENLGKFVQVQSKDRDKVATTAESLRLSEFIPRSYIEQVQLSKLTQDFQTFTDDVRRRFSMSSNPGGAEDLYGSSPPPFGGLLSGHGSRLGIKNRNTQTPGRYGRGRGGSNASPYDSYNASYNDMDDALLSCSAPVRGSLPIAIQAPSRKQQGSAGGGGSLNEVSGTAAAAAAAPTAVGATECIVSPTSSAAAAAGSSTVGCGSINSTASSIGDGSLPGSLENGLAKGIAVPPAAATASAGSRSAGIPPSKAGASGGGSDATSSKPRSSLLGQQLRRGSQNGSSSSLTYTDAAAVGTPEGQQGIALPSERPHRVSGAAGGQDFSGSAGVGFGAEGERVGVQALRRLQEQMDVVAEGFKRHSGMQLHLDALTHQYKHLNESMAALTAATQALGNVVQGLQQEHSGSAGSTSSQPVAAAQRSLLGSWLSIAGADSSSSAGIVLLALGAVLGAAVGAVAARGSR